MSCKCKQPYCCICCSELRYAKVQDLSRKLHDTHIKGIDEYLNVYFTTKYGYSRQEIEGFVSRTNNFKLKNFKCVEQERITYFYDNDQLILKASIRDGLFSEIKCYW